MGKNQSRLQSMFPGDEIPKYRYLWASIPGPNAMAGTYVGLGSGAPAMAEVGSSGIGGLRIEAATDDAAALVMFPDDVDIKRDIDVRVIWCSDETTIADSYTWDVNYKEILLNTTAIAAPATALDTAIAADLNHVTSDAMQATAWGTIDAATLTGVMGDGYVHLFEVDPSAVGGTASSDVVVLFALQFRYMPRKM